MPDYTEHNLQSVLYALYGTLSCCLLKACLSLYGQICWTYHLITSGEVGGGGIIVVTIL